MNRKIKGIIESLLFAWGEPLSASKIANVLGEDVKKVKEAINELSDEYKLRESGLQIIKVDNMYQFSTIPSNGAYVEELFKTSKAKGLSQSSLEVLSIIAYKQPITKGEIDYIRGVKSDKPLSNLLDRNLVEVKGKLDKIGRPNIFGTTQMFLKSFGFSSLKDLPNIKEFENGSKFLENFREVSLEEFDEK